MLVTFGRAATRELRERVRERLVSAERGAAPTRRRRGQPADDPVLALLADAPDAEVVAPPATGSRRRWPTSTPRPSPPPTGSASRCSPGSASPATSTPTPTFVEDLDDLVDEVVDDLYLRKFAGRAAEPAVRPARPRSRVAQAAVGDPQARARAGRRRPGSSPADARAARRGGARRGRAAQAAAPAARLRRPAHPAARRAAPTRCTARPPRAGARRATGSCWSTSSRTPTRCSGRSCATRLPRAPHAGADRRPEAGDLRLPRRRRRSPTSTAADGRRTHAHARHATGAATQPLLDALRRACSAAPRSATSGSSCRPVEPPRTASRGCRRAAAAPLRLRRRAPRDGRVRRPARRGHAVDGRGAIVAARRRRRHRRPAARRPSSAARRRRAARPVQPGDIAVLVRTNARRASVRDALAAAGVPAVLTGAGSVFAPRAARGLAGAAARRSSSRTAPGRVRAAALTRVRRLDAEPSSTTAGDDGARRARRRGCAAWARRAAPTAASRRCSRRSPRDERLPARVLGTGRTASGSSPTCATSARCCTPAASTRRLGLTALVGGCAAASPRPPRRRRGAQPAARVRRRRRPGRDRAPQQGPGVPGRLRARSRGTGRRARAPRAAAASTTADGGRMLDVGGPSTARATTSTATRHVAEEPARTCGCAYVALTRASCQVVAWWAPSRNTPRRRRCTGCCSAPRGTRHGAARPSAGAADATSRPRWPTLAAARPGTDRASSGAERPHGVPWRPPPDAGAGAGRRARSTAPLDTALAAHVVHRADRRPPRRDAGQRVGSEPEDSTRRRGRPTAAVAAAAAGRRGRRGAARRAVAAGATCPAGRRSARWCTPCSSTSTPTRRRPRRRAAPTALPSSSALRRRRGADRRARRRAAAGARHPARAARRRPPAARHRAAPTGSPSWTSSCRSPAATTPAPRRRPSPRSPTLLAPAPARRRPARRLRRRRSRDRARRAAAARLPHRQHRRRAAARRRRRRRASSSSTTRRTGSASTAPSR